MLFFVLICFVLTWFFSLSLQPENILLYRKGQLDIRIADFGLALQISPGEQVKTLVGTAEYVGKSLSLSDSLSSSSYYLSLSLSYLNFLYNTKSIGRICHSLQLH